MDFVNARWMLVSTWIPTWHQMDHVSWSLGLLLKDHLLEVGLTQTRKIMALQTLTTVDLFKLIMCGDRMHINPLK